MGKREELFTSPDATLAWGEQWALSLPPGSVLALDGELGAGKTTLIKGIVQGLTGIQPQEVLSPTFVYLNIYDIPTCIPVYHFDLYRLHNEEEFLSLGFEEYLFGQGICCLEWSERIFSLLPPHTIKITLSHVSEYQRLMEMYFL